MDEWTATTVLKRAKENEDAARKKVKKTKNARESLLREKTKAYLFDRFAQPEFKLPFEVSCYENSERGPKLNVTPDELRPILDQLLQELNDEETILYVKKQTNPYTCECGPLYCGHAGSFIIDAREVNNKE
jgi:hypothetical protein